MTLPPPGTFVVIPCYNNPAAAHRVVASLPPELLPRVLVVDDGSEPPLSLSVDVRILRHPKNRGYGGAQKTGYAAALETGAERVVLLHGDGQYPTGPTLDLARALVDTGADAALGSRFLEHHGREIPGWRRWGNRLLTTVANLRFGTRLSELHSGARAFTADALWSLPLEQLSDDYLFDQQVLAALLKAGRIIVERPLVALYDDTVQSISFRRSIRYGLGCLGAIARPPSLQEPDAGGNPSG